MQETPVQVVLDPGHGGAIPNGKSTPIGAVAASGLAEKDVTLAVAAAVARELGGAGSSAGVVLTRSADVNPSLAERIATARGPGAPVFVSVHANAGAPGHTGAELYVHERAGDPSTALAAAIADGLARLDAPVRPPQRAPLAVLHPDRHAVGTAACLVEIDYLSDPAGERRLADPAAVDAIATAIAAAIRRHLGQSGAVAARAMNAPLVTITHAGPYRLAYDRLTTLGVIEPAPNRDTRTFRGTQALQDALDLWAGFVPTVMDPPAYVLTGGLTVNKPGEHGAGNAIDVDGFWWSDTNTFLANDAPTDWYRYLTYEATLRKAFGTVLNWDYNANHHDHWHCDLGHSTAWRAAESQAKFVQRALREIWRFDLAVTGTWDADSRAALAEAGYDFDAAGGWDRFLDDMIRRQSTPP